MIDLIIFQVAKVGFFILTNVTHASACTRTSNLQVTRNKSKKTFPERVKNNEQ